MQPGPSRDVPLPSVLDVSQSEILAPSPASVRFKVKRWAGKASLFDVFGLQFCATDTEMPTFACSSPL